MSEKQFVELTAVHLQEMKKNKRKIIATLATFAIPIIWAIDCMVKGNVVPTIVFLLAATLFVVCAPIAIVAAGRFDKHRDFLEQMVEDFFSHQNN